MHKTEERDNMTLRINNQNRETNADDVSRLAEELQLPKKGVAIAVNGSIVPRKEWNGFAIKEMDNITVVKAAFGG